MLHSVEEACLSYAGRLTGVVFCGGGEPHAVLSSMGHRSRDGLTELGWRRGLNTLGISLQS